MKFHAFSDVWFMLLLSLHWKWQPICNNLAVPWGLQPVRSVSDVWLIQSYVRPKQAQIVVPMRVTGNALRWAAFEVACCSQGEI